HRVYAVCSEIRPFATPKAAQRLKPTIWLIIGCCGPLVKVPILFEAVKGDARGRGDEVISAQAAARPIPFGNRIEHPEKQARDESGFDVGAQFARRLRFLDNFRDEAIEAA